MVGFKNKIKKCNHRYIYCCNDPSVGEGHWLALGYQYELGVVKKTLREMNLIILLKFI